MNNTKYLSLIFLAACGVKSTQFITGLDGEQGPPGNSNDERVAQLEKRLDDNDALDSLQSSLISANTLAINVLNDRADQLESSQQDLYDLLLLEQQARIDGDNALAASLATEISVRIAQDALLQSQIDGINSAINTINSSVNYLQSQVNSNSGDISNLYSLIGSLQSDVSNLNVQLSSDISSLQSQISNLMSLLNSQEVKVYACKRNDNSLSKERFIKIAGLYYGAMNYVSTAYVQTITGSSSTSITIPKLCQKDDKMKSVPGSGNCPHSWDLVAGSGVTQTIPSYTTANVLTVTSVQIALEQLLSGYGYVTTDNSTPCYFNGNGTNLVQVSGN